MNFTGATPDPDRRTGRTTKMCDAAKPGDWVVMLNEALVRDWAAKYPALKFVSVRRSPEFVRGTEGQIHIDHACYDRGGPHLSEYVRLSQARVALG